MHMKMTRNAARVLSVVMALAMVLAMAVPAGAESDAVSVELVLASEGIEASGKVTVSPDLVASVGARLLLNGQTFADLTGYFSAQAAAVESGFLDKTYGVDFATLAENLKTSIFAPDSGSRFALDQESFDQLQGLFSGSLDSQLPDLSGLDPEALNGAFQALGAAASQAMDGIGNKLAMESAPATVTVNGQDISVTRAKVTAGTEALIAFYDSLLTSLEGDTELQNAVAVIVDFVSVLAASEGDDSIPDGATAVQTILGNMDEIRQELTQSLTEAGIAVALTVCMTEEENPVQLAMDITVDGQTVSGSLLMSENQDYIRLEMVDVDGTVSALQYDLTVNTGLAFGFHFGSYEGENETFSLVYDQDSQAQTFDVAVTTTDTDYGTGEVTSSDTTVSGSYANSDNLFTLVVDKVNGESFGGTLTLNVRTDDTVTMPAFSELTRLEETEFASVVETLQTGLATIGQLFGSAADSITPAA